MAKGRGPDAGNPRLKATRTSSAAIGRKSNDYSQIKRYITPRHWPLARSAFPLTHGHARFSDYGLRAGDGVLRRLVGVQHRLGGAAGKWRVLPANFAQQPRAPPHHPPPRKQRWGACHGRFCGAAVLPSPASAKEVGLPAPAAAKGHLERQSDAAGAIRPRRQLPGAGRGVRLSSAATNAPRWACRMCSLPATGGGSAPGIVADLRALPTGVYTARSHAREGTVVKRLVKE